jgi:hypothetical protein
MRPQAGSPIAEALDRLVGLGLVARDETGYLGLPVLIRRGSRSLVRKRVASRPFRS